MAFSTGTVKSINAFVDAMAVLAVANSWAILEGSENQSDSGVFPFSSRYMRLQFSGAPSGLRLAEIDFRSTVDGSAIAVNAANIQSSSGSESTNVVNNILDGNSATFWQTDPSNGAILEIDFGSTTTVREIVLETLLANNSPTTITISRSEDGEYWDEIHTFNSLSWSNAETKELALPADDENFSSSTATGGVRRACKYWLRGPGYDAARRVYVGFELFQDFNEGNQGFAMQGATGWTANQPFDSQLNALPGSDCPMFVIDNTTEDIDYWLYVNSTRITAVLRAGAGDYATFYCGFLAAFADPDEHTNPLYIAGTSPNLGTASSKTFYPWNEANASNTVAWDPGQSTAFTLDYKGDWINVENNQDTSALGRRPIGRADSRQFWVAPFYFGSTNSGSTVNASYSMTGSDGVTNGDHILKNLVLTLQDEVPFFDCLVQGYEYGHVGKLQGIVAVPGVGGLTPEQVITLGSQDYRVFPKRTTRDDAQWVAIEET